MYSSESASNNRADRPADLDAAVVDRIDEMVEFPLPGLEQREQLVKLYFGLLLEGKEAAGGGNPITTKDIGDAEFKKVAELTEGYSGRAISKLMISLQGHVYGKEVTELDAAEMMEVVTAKMASYEKRGQLLDLQEAYVRRGVAREAEDG